MTEDRMQTVVERLDGTAVIRVQGDLTAAGADTLECAFGAAVAGGPNLLVIAFRDTDHINSAGIGVLIGLVMECRKRHLTMALAHPSAHFRRIFDIVGLSRYVAVSADVAGAVTGST